MSSCLLCLICVTNLASGLRKQFPCVIGLVDL